jgi:hypothetical protein
LTKVHVPILLSPLKQKVQLALTTLDIAGLVEEQSKPNHHHLNPNPDLLHI